MGAASVGGSTGGSRRRGRGRRPVMSEINVTPMVDVMLVLLIIFMVAAPLAIIIAVATHFNARMSIDRQKARIASHAPNVLAVVSLIFAAGVFTGVLSGTGMVEAMAKNVVALIPEGAGQFLPLVTAVAAARSIVSGPSVSGNPCPRFTDPVRVASSDISAKMVVPNGLIRSTSQSRVVGVEVTPSA